MGFVGKVKTQVDSSVTYNSVGSTLYGYCSSAGNSAAKEVNVGLTTLSGMNGITIHVQFKYANSAANPTLNVDGTGAKYIYQYNDVTPGNVSWDSWATESVVSFTYDSDSDAWRMNDSGANKAIVTKAATEVAAEQTARAAAVTGVANQIAAPYSSTMTYALGDLCIRSDALYECSTQITTAEEWTAGHWTAVKVSEELCKSFRFLDTQIGIKSTASADIGESTGITSAEVDVTEYEKYLQTDAVFVYNQTQWDITGGASGIDPATYGITVEGTPANGDTIAITYTAGTFPFKKDTDNTYPAFPYKSTVTLDGITSSMVVDVIFGCEDAISGMFAPIVEAFDGGIYIYATNIPDYPVTIPTIVGGWVDRWER